MEKNSSKIISADQADKSTKAWSPPHVEGVSGSDEKKPSAPPTAAELDSLRQQAYQEGFEQGKKEGFEFGHQEALESGRQQLTQKTLYLDTLMSTLEEPLKQVDDDVEQEIVTLALTMVKQLVRREIQINPDQIIGIVREALSILPVGARNVKLLLNPEDAIRIREIYQQTDADVSWKIVDDPVMQQGGCRIETDTSVVDATLESRLANLMAPLLGGQREEDDVE